uniref:Ig-like domain-containing protein n=1 Tax=Varanus komodoensis TaxID=61221 RepID=A0A8D2JA94_VARKO
MGETRAGRRPPPCRQPGCGGSWPATLLAAAILSSCLPLTQAQEVIPITWTPQYPRTGQNMTLKAGGTLEKVVSCSWFRGTVTDVTKRILVYYLPPVAQGQVNGPSYTGRETVGADCSLHIRNLTLNDSGNYTMSKEGGVTAVGHVTIEVSEILNRPALTPESITMVENSTVVLQCSTSTSSRVIVSWLKDVAPVRGTAELSNQNRTLTLPGITKDDAGSYTCVVSNPVSNASSSPANLVVQYGPYDVRLNQSGTISETLGSLLALQCLADSFPLAKFQWFFNDTDQNVDKDTFSVQLKTWENGGVYKCQAYNARTNRTGSESVTVTLKSKDPPPTNGGGLSSGAIAGIVIGSLVGVALISGLIYFVYTKTSLGRTEQHISNGNIPSTPGHNQGVSETKARSGEEDIQYSTLAFSPSSPAKAVSAPPPPPPSESNTIYSEIKKKLSG